MLKRLVFLLLLAVATVSVSPPAQAAGLTVSMSCSWLREDPNTGVVYIQCQAVASNGLSPYTFRWYRGTTLLKTETTSGSSNLPRTCGAGQTLTFQVNVTDARGAQASKSFTIEC